MDLDLTGKTAIVTGSTRGIGLATAIGLAGMGADVVVNGRSDAAVQEAIGKLRQAVPSARAQAAPFDLASAEGCAALTRAFPSADILVNNLGIYAPKPFFDLGDEDWREMFDVNVMSGVRLTRHYLKGMLDTKDWGRVVFVSSESGLQIPVEMIHYGMTKTAQIAVARGLAEATVGSGVTVNSVLPGPTLDREAQRAQDMVKRSGKPLAEVEQDFINARRPTSLIKRFARPEEVASLIVYVASPLASATTGAALRVDGGVVKSAF